MGAGIAAAIPLVFRPYENDCFDGPKADYFSHGFLENYTVEEKESKNKQIRVMRGGSVEESRDRIYTIKSDLLLDNYRFFLTEFYALIGEDLNKRAGVASDGIPDVKDMDDFIKIFSEREDERQLPFICSGPWAFSVLGCQCEEYWIFYTGSYKAYLEEYRTLLHFEKILAKTMSSPLANAVKLGIFG